MSLEVRQVARSSQIEDEVLKKAVMLWDELDKNKPKEEPLHKQSEIQYPSIPKLAGERREARGLLNYRCVKAYSTCTELGSIKRAEEQVTCDIPIITEEISEGPRTTSTKEGKREVWTTRIVPGVKKKRVTKKRLTNQQPEQTKRRSNNNI